MSPGRVKMLQIAVCDDHADEIANMVQLIDQYNALKDFDCEYTGFPNGIELIAALEKGNRFDVYCLDIIMPGFSGMDAAKEIRGFDKTAQILFFTSSPEYAADSYSVDAVNYVLKPVTKEKMFSAFDKMLERIQTEKDEVSVIVKSNEGIQKITISHLVFAEVSGHTVRYHLYNGRVIECRTPRDSTEPFSVVCENLLKYGCFSRPHYSYLVNMRYVKTIENNKITLKNNSSVPVAKSKAGEIKERYFAYKME
ncbi:MAG: LytTR family DNA-binding domain-containing protein [Treponema sp.]|jgi:DNA-binding LytR/AlgR family response regulator|nr:LytTR family DNA-binding domain-containing protein [Treponema sp.]